MLYTFPVEKLTSCMCFVFSNNNVNSEMYLAEKIPNKKLCDSAGFCSSYDC